MTDKCYRDDANSDEREIIKGFFAGKSPKTLAEEYRSTKVIKSEKTGKEINMPQKDALRIVHIALTKISWGGVALRECINSVRRVTACMLGV